MMAPVQNKDIDNSKGNRIIPRTGEGTMMIHRKEKQLQKKKAKEKKMIKKKKDRFNYLSKKESKKKLSKKEAKEKSILVREITK